MFKTLPQLLTWPSWTEQLNWVHSFHCHCTNGQSHRSTKWCCHRSPWKSWKLRVVKAKNEFDLPSCVQFLDGVESVLGQFYLRRGRATPFILVCWNVNPVALKVAQAIPGHHNIGAFSLNQFDTPVIRPWANFAPVPSWVKVIETTAWMCAHTLVADQPWFQTSLEWLCCKMARF